MMDFVEKVSSLVWIQVAIEFCGGHKTEPPEASQIFGFFHLFHWNPRSGSLQSHPKKRVKTCHVRIGFEVSCAFTRSSTASRIAKEVVPAIDGNREIRTLRLCWKRKVDTFDDFFNVWLIFLVLLCQYHLSIGGITMICKYKIYDIWPSQPKFEADYVYIYNIYPKTTFESKPKKYMILFQSKYFLGAKC